MYVIVVALKKLFSNKMSGHVKNNKNYYTNNVMYLNKNPMSALYKVKIKGKSLIFKYV